MPELSDEELGRSFVKGMALHTVTYEMTKAVELRDYWLLEHYGAWCMYLREQDWRQTAYGYMLLKIAGGSAEEAEGLIRDAISALVRKHLERCENDNSVKRYGDMVMHILERDDEETWRYAEELGEELRDNDDIEA